MDLRCLANCHVHVGVLVAVVVIGTIDESEGRGWKDSQSERSGLQRSREERQQRVLGAGNIVKVACSNLGPADPGIGFEQSNHQPQLFVRAKVKDMEKPGQDQVQC